MKRTACCVLVPLLSLLPGCTSTTVGQYYVGADDYVLASRTGPEGVKDQYELRVGSVRGDGMLRVVHEFDRERPTLGFQAAEVDKREAERRGVKPYSGLLVKGVAPKSSAAEAGVLAGDVLVSIDGKEMVYLPQLGEFESTLRKDQTVSAKVLRGQSELDLSLGCKVVRERASEAQEIPLEAPNDNSRPYAGVTLRGIPAEWCQKIYGAPRQAVVVTNVEVGSPAWLAGVRAGDVVDTVDGAPVPPAADLARAIAERGAQGQQMQWHVSRGAGVGHDATVRLADYSGEGNVWIPLVFCLENATYADRWSIGPWGLVMSNRNHYVANSSSRTVQTRNVFSALLGLLRVETSPEETEVRLLWFLRFDT